MILSDSIDRLDPMYFSDLAQPLLQILTPKARGDLICSIKLLRLVDGVFNIFLVAIGIPKNDHHSSELSR
jgi:hypothetical protein